MRIVLRKQPTPPVMVEYIDATPTWRGFLPTLLAGLEAATPASRKIAIEELERMADLADAHVAASKENGDG